MNLNTADIAARTDFFSKLLQCNEKIIFSTYNTSGTLISTNAANMIYDTLLRYSKCLEDAVLFGENSSKPIIITIELGIMWSVVFEYDEYHQLQLLHVMGPILSNAISEETMKALLKKPNIREKWKTKLVKYLKDIPIVPATNFFNYSLMLHYCVNEQYLNLSDITFLEANAPVIQTDESTYIDYAQYWNIENQMADFIRKGDIYYKGKIHSAASILSSLQPLAKDNFSEAKQLATAFCGLCIRAAIDGGISPDTAYTKGMVYLNNITVINSFAGIISICQHVFEDFLYQVHMHQPLPQYSKEIAFCVEYIETHSSEELSIDSLAQKCGYSKYYLSKKFKEEVGTHITSYIKKARINHASYLLVTTNMSIQEISDLLHFGNRNFFTKTFKQETGTTPGYFRQAHQHHIKQDVPAPLTSSKNDIKISN